MLFTTSCYRLLDIARSQPSKGDEAIKKPLVIVISLCSLAILACTGTLVITKQIAAKKLALARKQAADTVASDKIAMGRLEASNEDARKQEADTLGADRAAIDELAKTVVPKIRGMTVDRDIKGGEQFAGMISSNGFSLAPGSPIHFKEVPDEEGIAKLAQDRKEAAEKLAADQAASVKLAADQKVASKHAADKLAADEAALEALSQESAS